MTASRRRTIPPRDQLVILAEAWRTEADVLANLPTGQARASAALKRDTLMSCAREVDDLLAAWPAVDNLAAALFHLRAVGDEMASLRSRLDGAEQIVGGKVTVGR